MNVDGRGRHRATRAEWRWPYRVAFSIAVLAGSTAAGLLAAGVIWLAIEPPRSPDRVTPTVSSPAAPGR